MKLSKLQKLPTLQNVVQRYCWEQNELEVGKGPYFKPPVCDIASFLEEGIHETWSFANLGNILQSSRRIKEKNKYSINIFPV